MVLYKGLPVPILNDYIVVLSPKGEIKKEISLYKILKKEVPSGRFICINFFWIPKPSSLIRIIKQRNRSEFIFNQGPPFDILHTNTIEIIGKDIDGLCEKGDLLISLCFLDLIGILDIEREKIIWKWGPGHLDRQHHPTLLENENILIFDNGTNRKYSRIIELDPLTKKIVWEYTSKPLRQFFSPTRGGNQRLPNGNSLITESDRGRVFEITKNGEIVWEFYNPVIDKTTKKRE